MLVLWIVLPYRPFPKLSTVLDGSLLHRIKWTEGSTYSSVAETCASFTAERYGDATVVFDGYKGPNTKDSTHERWKTTALKNTVNNTEAKNLWERKRTFFPMKAAKSH